MSGKPGSKTPDPEDDWEAIADQEEAEDMTARNNRLWQATPTPSVQYAPTTSSHLPPPDIFAPKVTLLKRPETNRSAKSKDRSGATQDTRTFQQRQQDYKDARDRIFKKSGSATPPSESPRTALGTSSSSGVVSTSGPQASTRQPPNTGSSESAKKMSVVRNPLGPDGSKGFDRARAKEDGGRGAGGEL